MKGKGAVSCMRGVAQASTGAAWFGLSAGAILETLPDGVLGLDQAGDIRFPNPAATRLTGFNSPELFGQPPHPRLHHPRADGTPYPAEVCPLTVATALDRNHTIHDEVIWR